MVWWKPSGRRQQLQKKKSSGRKGRSQGGNRCCCEHVQVLRGRSSCRQWFFLTVKLGVLGLGLIGLEMQLSPSKMPEASPETEGEQRCLNLELWHACAGPLVSLPVVGSRVIYFPQGHSEQVAASTNKGVDAQIPNYPNLPPQLICQLHNVTTHADVETEEVYAQMTLQPLSYGGEANIRAKTSGGRIRVPAFE